MACFIPPSTRDLLVRLFRAEVYSRNNFVEFPPQAEFRLATEGWQLTPQVVEAPSRVPKPFDPDKVRPEDYPIVAKPIQVLVPAHKSDPDAKEIGETGNWAKYQWQQAVPRQHGTLHPDGSVDIQEGVIARQSSMLASFKNGKSKEIGMWLTGFACLPGATIDLVGLEYGTSEHEFNYLIEALLSGTRPVVKQGAYEHLYNDVRAGRMYLELKNGCSYGVRSYKNKDALRGGQITCYAFNEIYQLPGLEVYTGHAQNLRVEKGFSVFTSTPDKPWVKVLHKMAHGKNPGWHCVCDNNAFVNPFSFDLAGLMADLPDWDVLREHAPTLLAMCLQSGLQPGSLMSKEKFLISWLGQMGSFVGRVYGFSKPEITCYPHTHPKIFKPSVVTAWNQQHRLIEQVRHA